MVDADSSQQAAIVAAKHGVSMVIDGPPGTGKSQTITNIIGECLADGKTVLFVSEKAAALEVVKRRLENVGLGDFVLELHSRKTSKKVGHAGTPADARPRAGFARHLGADRGRTRRRRAMHSMLTAASCTRTLGCWQISPFRGDVRAIALSGEPEVVVRDP